MDQRDYDLKNIELTGKEWQLSKLAEESAELAVSILQYKNKDALFKNMEKEIADVKIAIRYFELMFGTTNINKYIRLKEQKINRKVRRRIKELKK